LSPCLARVMRVSECIIAMSSSVSVTVWLIFERFFPFLPIKMVDWAE
jgi:hypothetical protein